MRSDMPLTEDVRTFQVCEGAVKVITCKCEVDRNRNPNI